MEHATAQDSLMLHELWRACTRGIETIAFWGMDGLDGEQLRARLKTIQHFLLLQRQVEQLAHHAPDRPDRLVALNNAFAGLWQGGGRLPYDFWHLVDLNGPHHAPRGC